MHYSRLLSFVLMVIWVTGSASGQSLTRTERLDIGRSAYETEDWSTASEQIEEILSRWPKDKNALLLKAKIALFGPELDVSTAKKAIRKLPKATRNSHEVQEIDLWMDYRYGGSFLPGARLAFQLRRSKKLLEEDSESHLANLVAGSIKLEDYRDLNHAVRFAMDADLDQIIAMMGPASGASEDGSYVSTGARGTIELPVIQDEQAAQDAGDAAIKYLLKASGDGPLRKTAFRLLAETGLRSQRLNLLRTASEAFVKDYPDEAQGYLVLGLTLFLQGFATEADIQFKAAVQLLSEEERLVYTAPSLIERVDKRDKRSSASRSDSSVTDYWARKDFLWSSPVNERETEHRARVVYADLVWGRPESGRRGWETEPGKVHIRYGWPQLQMQFQDAYDKFYYVDYGYRAWVFHDLAKAGKFIFWSPEGGSASSSGLCDRGRRGLDYEKCKDEWFRDDPERSQRQELNRVKMQTVSSLFENDGVRTLVVPLCFPETDQYPGTHIAVFDRPSGSPVPDVERLVRMPNRDVHWSEMPCDVAQVVVQQIATGEHQISMEVEGLNAFATSRFEIERESAAEGLRLSDLLLARLIEEDDEGSPESVHPFSLETGESWIRFGKTIYPVAQPSFESGSPIYLYLETYGLPGDTDSNLSFQAALVLGQLNDSLIPKLGQIFGKKEEASVSVEFEQTIRGNMDSRYFILETNGVQAGSYVLAVRVIEKRTGRQAVISREIVIK